MEFGLQFFPAVSPPEKSGRDYWLDAIYLSTIADNLGYTSVRTVEHYCHPYGGYSPNPLLFLCAIAMTTSRVRLVTGALVPAFSHPLKLASEIGMADCISNGRLDVGLARAFLPHEFDQFGVSIHESNDRFQEAVKQIDLLLTHQNISSAGKFHTFHNATSWPRPQQHPRPRLWIAATSTPASFAFAGLNGYCLMCIPGHSEKMRDLLEVYRQSWKDAGHPGTGRVMMAFHLYCANSERKAVCVARPNIEKYFSLLRDATSAWITGRESDDYPGYPQLATALQTETFWSLKEANRILIGTPKQVMEQLIEYKNNVGGFEEVSLQINFAGLRRSDAEESMRLFSAEVIPAMRS